MKTYWLSFSLLLLTFLFLLPSPASAQLCPPGQFARLCSLRLESTNVVGAIIGFLLIFAIIIALIFLVLGGIRWIMSGGDKGKIDQARSTITAAVVGLLIALLAFLIINIVSIIVTGGTFGILVIPRLIN